MRDRPLLLLPAALLVVSLLAPGCASSTDTTDGTDGTTDSDLTTANEKTAFDYFVAKGLTKTQAAAIVGNLQQESNVKPTSVQPGGPGRGIAQWSAGARWNVSKDDNVAWFAEQQGSSVESLELQLDFIWYELESFSMYGLASLRKATTMTAAVYAFQRDFEACGACNESHRVSYANAVLKAYGND